MNGLSPPSSLLPEPATLVSQLPNPLADSAVVTSPEQVHHHCWEERKDRGANANGAAVDILAKLNVENPMPFVYYAPARPNHKQQELWHYS